MSHVKPINKCCCTCEWVMFHQWMSGFSHMNELCLTYGWVCLTCEWVVSHMWMSCVSHMNESCLTYQWVCPTCGWVVSHIWMSHVSHMNALCLTYEWLASHIWMSDVSHMNESCLTYEWVMSHIWMSHVSHMTHPCRFTRASRYALRLVGSLKSEVSFAEYSLFYRALLQKRPVKEPTHCSHPIAAHTRIPRVIWLISISPVAYITALCPINE